MNSTNEPTQINGTIEARDGAIVIPEISVSIQGMSDADVSGLIVECDRIVEAVVMTLNRLHEIKAAPKEPGMMNITPTSGILWLTCACWQLGTSIEKGNVEGFVEEEKRKGKKRTGGRR